MAKPDLSYTAPASRSPHASKMVPCRIAAGKVVEAEPLFRAALKGYRQRLGDSHPHTVATIGNLAALLSGQVRTLYESDPVDQVTSRS